MPGRVVRVLVSQGEHVERGSPLLVLEAMKMENEVRAPQAGAVTSIFVQAGSAVEANARLVALR
jgi:biotin carboxyl carrier protein